MSFNCFISNFNAMQYHCNQLIHTIFNYLQNCKIAIINYDHSWRRSSRRPASQTVILRVRSHTSHFTHTKPKHKGKRASDIWSQYLFGSKKLSSDSVLPVCRLWQFTAPILLVLLFECCEINLQLALDLEISLKWHQHQVLKSCNPLQVPKGYHLECHLLQRLRRCHRM